MIIDYNFSKYYLLYRKQERTVIGIRFKVRNEYNNIFVEDEIYDLDGKNYLDKESYSNRELKKQSRQEFTIQYLLIYIYIEFKRNGKISKLIKILFVVNANLSC